MTRRLAAKLLAMETTAECIFHTLSTRLVPDRASLTAVSTGRCIAMHSEASQIESRWPGGVRRGLPVQTSDLGVSGPPPSVRPDDVNG
jgi:hypothetical protein